MGAAGVDGLSGEDQIKGGGDPDQARQPLRPPTGGDDPELHLGLAETGLRVVGGDAVRAGERQLVAASQAGAVDGGHHGLSPVGVEPLETVEGGVGGADCLGARLGSELEYLMLAPAVVSWPR